MDRTSFFPGLDRMPRPSPPALAVKVLDSWITPLRVHYAREYKVYFSLN